MKTKLFTKMFVLVVVVISLGVVGYAGWRKTNLNKSKEVVHSSNDEDIDVAQEKIEDKKIEKKTDTSDWLIYRNEEYGFEVSYPKYWEVAPSGTDVGAIDLKFFRDNTTEQAKLSPLLNFSITEGEFVDTLGKYNTKNYIINGLDYNIYNYKDGYSGFGYFTDIFLKKDDFYFFIGVNRMEDSDDALNRLLDIISTFNFIN